MSLKIIAALSENNIIGSDGTIPWRLPADMKWFRMQTGDRPVVMGRKTYESLPPRFRPLPNRENIVLTHYPERFTETGVTLVNNFEKVRERAERELLWVIGGGEIYRLALPYASEMYLTRVHTLLAGDAFFPVWKREEWEFLASTPHGKDQRNEHSFNWEVWKRK